ncbi:protein lifeguard 3 [Ictalurus punctatus]|uniref:Protein lifeguard 3 n=1 Tax=Ictalurus punctatus TaxID=7998 RepID=A0A2D0R413_ICTPU|nr:protein lifeguard 3 [Ictalurus punctatus]XP_047012255.1 protein lifeguard 3 [Ictalurus punctatus]
MFKSDVPPTYEESRHHQQQHYGAQPQGGNYPFTPYTFPTPVWHGAGAPPPGIPPVVPTYMSSGTPPSNPGNMEAYDQSALWENKSIRHAFIRKVYLILAAQLLFTATIVAVFTFVDPVRLFVIQYPVIYWVSLGVFFVTYLVLVCCEKARRRFPLNLVLLFIFTLAMSYMAGTISSYYETKAVFLAVGITALVCIVVTVFSFQTKVDFTSCTGLFCVLAIVLFITGIITTIVLSFHYIPWLHMLYAALGAIVYTLFLAYDTQLLLGNRAHSLSPEEYVFGALSLYTDIIQIFLFLLQITGSSTD